MALTKKPIHDTTTTDDMAVHYRALIERCGEDAQREGLIKTPTRAAKAMQFLTQGYAQDAEAILRGAMFAEDYSEMVIVKGHRVLQPVRTPLASLLRQGAHRLYTGRVHRRA